MSCLRKPALPWPFAKCKSYHIEVLLKIPHWPPSPWTWSPISLLAYFPDVAAPPLPCSVLAAFSLLLKRGKPVPVSPFFLLPVASMDLCLPRNMAGFSYHLGLGLEITSGRPPLTQGSKAPLPSPSRTFLPFYVFYGTVEYEITVCIYLRGELSVGPAGRWASIPQGLCHLLPSVPSIMVQWLTYSNLWRTTCQWVNKQRRHVRNPYQKIGKAGVCRSDRW